MKKKRVKKEPTSSGKRKRENSADNMSPKSSSINSNNSVSNTNAPKVKEEKSYTRKNSVNKTTTTNAISTNEIILKETSDTTNETQVETTKLSPGHNLTKKRNNSAAANTSPASRKYNQSKSLNEETDDVKSLVSSIFKFFYAKNFFVANLVFFF